MKDDKGQSTDTKRGNVYLVNENLKEDDGKTRAHPDIRKPAKKRGSNGAQKDDDPLSIGESDGSAG